MVARGDAGFAAAAAACLCGIFVGDLLLFTAGRTLGRAALARRPLRWLVGAADVERASVWIRRRGAPVVFLSRFTPGLRLPTYVAAGVLRTNAWQFAGWFLLAAAAWTPILVGAAAAAGGQAAKRVEAFRRSAPLLALAALAALLILTRVVAPAFTRDGRRRLAGTWRRLVRWEYWPMPALYGPVLPHLAWLALRYRSATVFTAANPAIPSGGFVGESKAEILHALERAGAPVARGRLLPRSAAADERVAYALEFMAAEGLSFPVVLKPDAGQRGSGVAVVRDRAALVAYLAAARYDAVVQAYVAGDEFGIFWVRHPGTSYGRIISITEKRFPYVTGDGTRTLEGLIAEDRALVAMAPVYLERLASRLDEIPEAGERVTLGEIGNHCRGAIFLDGSRLNTPELAASVDRVLSRYDGFCFGRMDVRASSAEILAAGGAFTILELNGVTSEATHIYDPALGVVNAWRTLAAQWSLAFEIGAANRALGHEPARIGDLARAWIAFREPSAENDTVPLP